jgi:hypothetical protein
VFTIGALVPFSVTSGFEPDLFDSDLTFSFWLKTDGPVSMGLRSTFHVLTLGNQAGGLSIAVIDQGIWVVTPSTKVCLSPRHSSNRWFFILIKYISSSNGRSPIIRLWRDLVPVEEASLSEPLLVTGHIEIRFGGFEGNESEGLIGGYVSDLCVYNRRLSANEDHALAELDAPKPAKGLLVSTDSAVCIRNAYRGRPLLTCLQRDGIARRHNARLLRSTREGLAHHREVAVGRTEEGKALFLLENVIEKTVDRSLSQRMAPFLLDRERTGPVYRQIVAIVARIENANARLAWFEDIVLNYTLWESGAALRFWSPELISLFRDFFGSKSYFRYLLSCFRALDSPAILFLKRVGHVRLEAMDLDVLFALLWDSRDNTPRLCSLLELLRDLAPVVSSGNDCLYDLLEHTEPTVVLLAIQCILVLSRESFCSRIIPIVERLKPTDQVMTALEDSLDVFPELFALNCGLAFRHPSLTLHCFPSVTRPWPFWYLFPILYYLKASEDSRPEILGFLVQSAIVADFDAVVYLVAFLSSALEPSRSDLLDQLFETLANVAAPDEMMFIIFQSLVCSFNATGFSQALVDEFCCSPFSERVSCGQKISLQIGDFDCIKTWEIPALPLQTFRPNVDLNSPRFHLLVALANQFPPESEHSLAARICTFCLHDHPVPPTFQLTMPMKDLCIDHTILDKRAVSPHPWWTQVSRRNDLFDEVIALARERAAAALSPIFEYLERFPNELFVSPTPLPPPPECVSSCVRLPPMIFRRANWLCGFCTRTLERVRPRAGVRRLWTVPSFVPDARLVSATDSIPVSFGPNEWPLSIISESATTVVDREEITDVLMINETICGLICRNMQYLLDFSPRSCKTFLERFAFVPGLRFFPGPEESLVCPWTEKWVERAITSFEYLCVVNLLSGRAFNGDLSLYPIFPAADVDFARCHVFSMPQLDGFFNGYEGAEGSMLAPAEIYFFPQILHSFQRVYENRKHLERCENLEVWLTRVFGTPGDIFLHRRVFHDAHPPRKPLELPESGFWQINIEAGPDERLLHCFALDTREMVFGCVYHGGSVTFGKISFGSDQQQFDIIARHEKLEGIQAAQVSKLGMGLAVYASSKLTIVTANDWTKYDRTYLKYFKLSDEICQVSETELWRLSVGQNERLFTEFTVLPAKILTFASSGTQNVTAVACDDCRLRIRSNRSGKKVATIDLDGELPTSVLVTQSWGMIVIKTLASIFVFDINGFPVAKVPNPSDFRIATAFHDRTGCDFIAYQDSEYRCFYFEAAVPERIIALEGGSSPLLCLDYDSHTDRFLLVADTGKVLVISRSLE